jgi:outer membrane protein assembly factor BamE (lipoprotein component of BamABCDE complex)
MSCLPAFARRITVLLAGCLLLGGCVLFEAPTQLRGNRVDAEQLKELVTGTSTRADVTALIGSPTARATFDDNTWLYITELTRPLIGRTNGIENQAVVVLTFNDQGVLQNIQQVDKAESMPVSVVARTTPSPGTEASFLQQLLGNVGRFTPGPTQQTNGPAGGAPSGPTP